MVYKGGIYQGRQHGYMEDYYRRLIDISHNIYKESRHDPNVDLYRVLDMYDSISHNQLKSKEWLVTEASKHITMDDVMCILGSWYGLLSYMFRHNGITCHIDNIDTDERAKIIAETIIQEPPDYTSFYTKDAIERYLDEIEWYTVLCTTSTEHFDPMDWGFLARMRPKEHLIIVQSNNNTSENEHVNCHETADDLAEDCQVEDIYYKGSMDFQGIDGPYQRHMVIGR